MNVLTNIRLLTELVLPWLQLFTLAMIAQEVRKNGKK